MAEKKIFESIIDPGNHVEQKNNKMLGTLQVALLTSLVQFCPLVCDKKIEMWNGFL